MNRNLHRIVFNAVRAQRMVVQETATSTGKGRNGASGGARGTQPPWLLCQIVAASILTLGGPLTVAQAQIVPNPLALPSQRPQTLVAPNGVPLVNITTPSAGGVSVNHYSQFDVGAPGAILNNSRTPVQSQLGGYIQGNPWLATGPARVIVNQVASSNPSYLNGYIEVAGQRAEVIIANPSGISVNGGGFINASRVTLTTGTPQYGLGGSLDGYVVNGTGGEIASNGALSVNLTGAFNQDGGTTSATAISIDAGSLSNKAGQIVQTGTGATHIGVSGALDNTNGAIASNGQTAVTAGTLTNGGGQIRTAGSASLSLTTTGLLDNSHQGMIAAGGNTTVTAGSLDNDTGRITAVQDLGASVAGAASNQGGTLAANGNTTVTAASLNNSGGNDPTLKDRIDWQQVEELHKQWQEDHQGLTKEGGIIVTAVVTWLTWGAASGVGATAGNAAAVGAGEGVALAGGGTFLSATGATISSVVSGAVAAGISALASQAAVSLINNQFDLSKTFKDLGSSSSVHSLVTAILTGGALAGLNMNPTGMATAGSGAQSFATQLGQNLQAGAIRAVIDTAVNGGSLQDRLTSGFINALVNTGAAQAANWIGNNTELNSFASYASHTIAGCIGGAAKAGNGGGCEAGAIGAALGEAAAIFYNSGREPLDILMNGPSPGTTEFAGMVGTLGAALAGADAPQLNVANWASQNAAANNFELSLMRTAALACVRAPACIGPVLTATGLASRGVTPEQVQAAFDNGAQDLQRQYGISPGVSQSMFAASLLTYGFAQGLINLMTAPPPSGTTAAGGGYGAGSQPQQQTNTGGNQLVQPAPGSQTIGGNQITDPQDGNAAGGYGAGNTIPDIDILTGSNANPLPPAAGVNVYAVPPSILDPTGKLPPGIGGSGTPIPMPPSSDPNATAEKFATDAFNGKTPTSVTPIGNGWLAKLPDGTSVLYRPAGQATKTDPTTASVDINSSGIRDINNGQPAKFKFPKL
ncbi:filamentous hemagglutinin family protein [Pseudacidovorax sp. 1753]|uniref:two-partner secretion domain-containing protein n=1 Tax=Pseudacidovorax sp. 1753 TaxID=3156419 RepID=UPI0033946B0A